MNAKWSVLAVYANKTARDLAVKFCDALVQRFWPERTFDLHWHESQHLLDPASSKHVCSKVGVADILIIATVGNIEPRVRNWLEMALRNRGDREGILVGLTSPEPAAAAEAAVTQQYLRKLAHQSGLDFLTTVPQSLSQGVPESFEACNDRATQVTSVLDTILHWMPQPPRVL